MWSLALWEEDQGREDHPRDVCSRKRQGFQRRVVDAVRREEKEKRVERVPAVTKIPLVDLAAQHRQIVDEINHGFARVLEQTDFILGEDVARFEEEFAEFVGVKHCVGVGSGTDALELMLRAAGIGRDDEVIVPTNSFIASALAVMRAGARPVLVDSNPAFHLIDVEDVARKITPRTKAILPVHLYGQMAPVEKLVCLDGSETNELLILEDAAQAHGARRHQRGVGTVGLAAATSFYPGKNLGAYGDGGALLTNSDTVAEQVRALRNYGSNRKYHHPEMGFNSRLDTLQAVVLRAKLKRLSEWNSARRRAAQRYDELLSTLPNVVLPKTLEGNEPVYHLYVVRVPERDTILSRLREVGVETGVHYPVPIHLQGAFSYLGHRPGDFPVAEKAAGEILSLPIYPGITYEQQERVVDELREALAY